MGVCGVTDLGASPGQMSVILEGTAVVGEVIIQTFGAMDIGMLMLLAFLIVGNIFSGYCPCPWDTELIHICGLASGRSGAFNMQNCPLAF